MTTAILIAVVILGTLTWVGAHLFDGWLGRRMDFDLRELSDVPIYEGVVADLGYRPSGAAS